MVNVSNAGSSLQSAGGAADESEDVSLNLLGDVLLVLDSNLMKLGGCCVELTGRKLHIIEDIKMEDDPLSEMDILIEKSLGIP